MKKYALIASLVVLVGTMFSGLIASHFMFGEPKVPSMLSK